MPSPRVHLLAVFSLTMCTTIASAEEPIVKSAAAPLSKEYLERWTPGGNTNDPELPYPQITAPFQAEDDEDWRDDRWQSTAKGPFVSHSILLPEYEIGPKVTAVDAGNGTYLLYDLETGSFVAAVTAGELRIDATRFGLLNRPSLTGNVTFHVPPHGAWRKGSPDTAVKRVAVDYEGLHLNDNRVLFVAKIDGIEVLESAAPNDDAGVVVREIQLAPHDLPMWTCLATGDAIEVKEDGSQATWRASNGDSHTVSILGAASDVRIEQRGSSVLLRWPKSAEPASARLRYWQTGTKSEASVDASTVKLEVAPLPPDLAALKTPAGRRWGDPLVTQGELAAESDLPYVVDRIPPPMLNPQNALFFLAGLDFFPNGDAAVCTVHGDVWVVQGLDADLEKVTWQRFATGLYQPLGLEVAGGKVIVLGRDQLTRLHDENGDGEADFYESFNHDLKILGQPHAYVMRLERTPDGSFVFLKSGEGPHGSSLLQLSPNGDRLEVLARGFRHPFGIGTGPNGEITAADNEGNWVPASKIDLILRGGFYGYLGAANEQGASPPPLRPLCFLPKVVDNSSGGQFWHTSERWGPYHRGKMFHFSWGRCTLHAVLEQHAGEVSQAATVEMPGVLLQSGPGESEFSPADGQLYVVGLDGWQTAATVDGSLERIRYTGKPVDLPSSFAAYDDGIELTFDAPLDPPSVGQTHAVEIEQWNYKWSSTYGSYHYSVNDPDRVGHDRIEVQSKTLSPDGKRLFISIAGLRPVDQIQLTLDLAMATGKPLKAKIYGTINALAKRDVAVTNANESKKPEANEPLSRLLAKENLVAWCIVPFDAKRRGPEDRAAMLDRLGIKRVAYDWREEHVAQFDEELHAYKRHGITLHAFWMPVNTESPLTERHWPLVLDLAKRHNVKPEMWVMLNNALIDPLPPEARAARAAEILAPAARAADELGCRIGLYNHGGWFGEPENQIAIIEAMRKSGIKNVGVVYNFHHGHEHMPRFPALANQMAPHLMTVNVNGMRAGGPKVVSFGQGDNNGNAERQMLKSLADAGYSGPIGILGHREDRDVEECLREGLEGISQPPK